MKYLGYLLKTRKYYIIVISYIFLAVIILLCFNTSWNRLNNVYNTFDNCSANNIAYDVLSDSKDSYANFENNAVVSDTQEEGASINAYVYQFLEGTSYTEFSLVNSKNVIAGKYSILDKNEIAIPKDISQKYKVGIGDSLYVNGNICEIKFIFQNIYQIYSVNFSISQTVVFVGINTVNLDERVNYCNFDPSETVHQNMKNLNDIRRNLSLELNVIRLSVIALFTGISILAIFVKKKEQIKAYRNIRFSGGKNILTQVIILELGYIFPVCIATLLLSKLFSISLLLSLYGIAVIVVCGVIDVIYLDVKIKR